MARYFNINLQASFWHTVLFNSAFEYEWYYIINHTEADIASAGARNGLFFVSLTVMILAPNNSNLNKSF